MKVWCARCAAYRPHSLSRAFGQWCCDECRNYKKTPRGYVPSGSDLDLTPSEVDTMTNVLTGHLYGLDDARAEAEERGDGEEAADLEVEWSRINTIIRKARAVSVVPEGDGDA